MIITILYIYIMYDYVHIVAKGLRKNLEAIPGKHSIYSVQKAAILGTSHVVLYVLQCET